MEHKLGLGCMGMAFRNEAESEEVIRTALENGISFLNTGDFYSSGESEMIIGNALKGIPRDKYSVSLKFGGLMSPDGIFYGLDVHPDRVKNYLTRSLKRLHLDYVDLYQPCRIDQGIPVEETIGAVGELVKKGYVKSIGISEVDADTLVKANDTHPISCVEMDYSLVNRRIESEVLPTARRLGIGIVAFGIIARGLLQQIETLRQIAEEKQITVAQLAYAWALSKGDDILPLIGTTKASHFKESVKAQDITLSVEDVERIEAAVPTGQTMGTGIRRLLFRNGSIVKG